MRVSRSYVRRGHDLPMRLDNVDRNIKRAVRHYPLSPTVSCPVLLIRADRGEASAALAERRWSRHTTGSIEMVIVRGEDVNHRSMIREPPRRADHRPPGGDDRADRLRWDRLPPPAR